MIFYGRTIPGFTKRKVGASRHGSVCCLRGGNAAARCFGDPLAGVLWVEVSRRCGFVFFARGKAAQADEKAVGWKEILAMKRREGYNEKKERG